MMLSIFRVFTFTILISSLPKILFKSFAHFLIGLFAILSLSFDILKIHSEYMAFVRKVICKYFLPIYNLSLYSLGDILSRAKVFKLLRFKLLIVFFTDPILVSFLRTLCLTLGHKRFS